MRKRFMWRITTSHGDEIITHPINNACTIRWARRHGYKCERILVLR